MELKLDILEDLRQKPGGEKKTASELTQDARNGKAEYRNTTETKNAPQGEISQLQGIADNNKRIIAEAQAIRAEYQRKIKETELLKSDIFKGIAAGEDLRQLFLKAIEALGISSDDPQLLQMIKQKMEKESRA